MLQQQHASLKGTKSQNIRVSDTHVTRLPHEQFILNCTKSQSMRVSDTPWAIVTLMPQLPQRTLKTHKESKQEDIHVSNVIILPHRQGLLRSTKSPNMSCRTCKLYHRKRKEVKLKGIRYPCDQCDYAATRAIYLRMHKKRNHLKGMRHSWGQYNLG